MGRILELGLCLGLCACRGAGPTAPVPEDHGEVPTSRGGFVHRSAIGPVPPSHQLERVPEAYLGVWRVSEESVAETAWRFDPIYPRLSFSFVPDPDGCRVLLDTDEGTLEFGTMPYLERDPEGLFLGFVGQFHLTYGLGGLLATGPDTLEGLFRHAGSGRVYVELPVSLVRQEP